MSQHRADLLFVPAQSGFIVRCMVPESAALNSRSKLLGVELCFYMDENKMIDHSTEIQCATGTAAVVTVQSKDFEGKSLTVLKRVFLFFFLFFFSFFLLSPSCLAMSVINIQGRTGNPN